MQAFHQQVKPERTWVIHLRSGLRNRSAVTVAALAVNGGDIYIGVAPCSCKDMFVRKIGREMALGRAKKRIANGEPPLVHVNIDDERVFECVREVAFKLLKKENLL